MPGKAQTVPGPLTTKTRWYLCPVLQETAHGCFQGQSAVWPGPAILMLCKWHLLLKMKWKIKRNQCFWSQAVATGKPKRQFHKFEYIGEQPLPANLLSSSFTQLCCATTVLQWIFAPWRIDPPLLHGSKFIFCSNTHPIKNSRGAY